MFVYDNYIRLLVKKTKISLVKERRWANKTNDQDSETSISYRKNQLRSQAFNRL